MASMFFCFPQLKKADSTQTHFTRCTTQIPQVPLENRLSLCKGYVWIANSTSTDIVVGPVATPWTKHGQTSQVRRSGLRGGSIIYRATGPSILQKNTPMLAGPFRARLQREAKMKPKVRRATVLTHRTNEFSQGARHLGCCTSREFSSVLPLFGGLKGKPTNVGVQP